MLVAIDAGNGWTKVLTPGRAPVQFPSLIARADAEWLEGYNAAPPLMADGQNWHVGDAARYEPNPIFPSSTDRLRQPHVVPLLAEALWRAGAAGNTVLATGLPLRVFKAEREGVMEAWNGRTLMLQRKQEIRRIVIAQCVVYPQGIAALAHLYPTARQQGVWPHEGLVGLVDVGRGTTELVVVEAATMAPRTALSTSFDIGVGTAVSHLTRWLQDQVQQPVSTDQAEDAWLRGHLQWRNRQINAAEGCRQALDAVGGRLATDIERWWRDQWANIQLVVLVGSSASEWAVALKRMHANIWVPEEPGLANVRGYLDLADPRSKAVAAV